MSKIRIEVELPEGYSPETPEQTEKLACVLAEYARLFAAKQKAYGRGNISAFGEAGVLVRLYDKVERLRNLLAGQRVNDLEPIRVT